MSSSGSFYDKKRLGKARSLEASTSNDVAGELLRHLDQTAGKTLDVSALVRDAEDADIALANTRSFEDTDAVVDPARVGVPFTMLTDDEGSTRQVAAAHAARRSDDKGASWAQEMLQVSSAQAPLLHELGYASDQPSLKIPFLVVGVIIVAALGLPTWRHASTPGGANQGASQAVVSSQPTDVVQQNSSIDDTAAYAIRSVVLAYADAYSRRDVSGVKAVYPNVDADALQTAFSRVAHQQVEPVELTVHVTGPRATVEAAWRTTGEAVNGSTFVTQSPVVLTLDQRDGRWLIVNRY